jgi:hypothetical protein
MYRFDLVRVVFILVAIKLVPILLNLGKLTDIFINLPVLKKPLKAIII